MLEPSLAPMLLAFVPVALLLALVPGADTALVTRNALARGTRGARWTIAGIGAGCLVHATASALGLSAILATSARAYDLVKLAGAAWLVWMGVQAIRHAPTPAAHAEGARGAGTHPFADGFVTNLLNPKVALFYLTFLPQFIPAGAPVLRTSLLLAAIHILLGFAWLSLYAGFVNQMRGALTRPAVKAWLERATGAALLLLGARLAWERR